MEKLKYHIDKIIETLYSAVEAPLAVNTVWVEVFVGPKMKRLQTDVQSKNSLFTTTKMVSGSAHCLLNNGKIIR